jgi:hypothetical protein
VFHCHVPVVCFVRPAGSSGNGKRCKDLDGVFANSDVYRVAMGLNWLLVTAFWAFINGNAANKTGSYTPQAAYSRK